MITLAIGSLMHSGFISSIKFDNLTPWYSLLQENETIEFKEADGTQRYLNDLLIEANITPLYVRILPSDSCIYVPAGESRNYSYEKISSIQVMNAIGTTLRWSGLYF